MFSPIPSPSPFNVGFNAKTSRFIKFYGKRQQHWKGGQGDGNVSNVERNMAIYPNSFESDCLNHVAKSSTTLSVWRRK